MKVVVSMESGTLEIREGREVIDTVRGSLEGIIHGTVEVTQGVREILTLAAEQARRSPGRWSRRPTGISHIAEDNAAAAKGGLGSHRGTHRLARADGRLGA